MNAPISAFAAAAILTTGLSQGPAAPPVPGDHPVLRIGVDLVRVDATVTDERGRHVTDLTADDFVVLQNNRVQKLSTFAFITGEPRPPVWSAPAPAAATGARPLTPAEVRRTIAIVVDDLGLSLDSIARVRAALGKFLDTHMQPGDLVAILRTGAGIGALQQFTTDRRVLHSAVDRVRYNFRSRGGPFARPDDADAGQLFRDEVFTAGTLNAIRYVVSGVAELPGRKSVVVVSDGFSVADADSRLASPSGGAAGARYGHILGAVRSVVDEANRAGVVIHGMHATGLTAKDEGRRAAEDSLGALAGETGGLFIRDANDLSRGLARVLDESRSYYLLGYVPDTATFSATNPRFHTLSVRVNRPGVRVRSRGGFLGQPHEDRKSIPPDRMIAAVTSPFAGGDVRLRLSSFFGLVETMGPVVRSFMHVAARDLTFEEGPEGTRTAQIETLAVTFGDNGERVDQDARRYTVTLTPDRYERALVSGFVHSVRVPVTRPGPYQLRVALRDVKSDRIGSASSFVEVPDIKKGRLTLSGLLIQGLPIASGAAVPEIEPNATVAVRTFRQGTATNYVSYVYNAKRGRGGQPSLDAEIRLYREGTEIFRNEPRALTPSPETPGEIVAAGVLQLGEATPPGSYLLEIVVTDKLTKKPVRATQTIDFEIVD